MRHFRAVRDRALIPRVVVVIFPLIFAFAPLAFAADPPASPAQLQALQGQIARLQAQRQAAAKELAEWQSAEEKGKEKLAAAQTKLNNLVIALGGQAAVDKLFGVDKTATAMDAGLAYFDALNEVNNRKKMLEAARGFKEEEVKKIAALDQQITQLRAKVRQAEAAELSQQVEQLQPGGSSGRTRSQSGPRQPQTYTATPQPPPAPGSVGAQPPPLPPGTYVTAFEVFCPGEAVAGETVTCAARGVYLHDPNTVVTLTESTTWDISGATEWKSGSEFRTKGAAVIIVTATRGNNRVTRTVHVKARRTETGSGTKPEGAGSAPPTGGGGCGPGTYGKCTCKGGLKGHIPCDPDKGSCHCG